MEKLKKFFTGKWVAIMIVVGLFLLKVFTGLPFWWMLGVVVLFTAVQLIYTGGEIRPGSKVLGVVMGGIFLLALGGSAWKAFFPRSYHKGEVTVAQFDIFTSKIMGDRTETNAKDLWEIQKDHHGEQFLRYYNRLLAEGKTQEAADTLKGFERAWDSKKKFAEKVTETDSAIAPQIPIVSEPRIDTLLPGIYHVRMSEGQQKDLFIAGRYVLASEDCKDLFSLFYPQAGQINAWEKPKPTLPDEYFFRLFSYRNQTVRITVLPHS